MNDSFDICNDFGPKTIILEILTTSFNQRLRIVWMKDCRFFYFERLLILSEWKNKQSFKIKESCNLSFIQYAIFDWNKSILLTRKIDQIFQIKRTKRSFRSNYYKFVNWNKIYTNVYTRAVQDLFRVSARLKFEWQKIASNRSFDFLNHYYYLMKAFEQVLSLRRKSRFSKMLF